MKKHQFNLLFLLIAFGLVSLNQAHAHPTLQDTTAEGNPIYQNVDVTVDYAWSNMERYDDVAATVIMDGNRPVAVVVAVAEGTRYEIQLIDEVTIKIYDHKTGKLLRTLGNSRAT